MGLFSRKTPKEKANGNLPTSNESLSPAHKQTNGFAFESPSLPDVTLPAPPDPKLDPAAYLRSIYAVRDRTKYVFSQVKRNKLMHFDVDMSKFPETAAYLVSIINVRELCARDRCR